MEGDEPRTVTITEHEHAYEIELDGETLMVDSVGAPGASDRSLIVQGRSYEVVTRVEKDALRVRVSGDVFHVKVTDELWARAESAAGSDAGGENLVSPMPGSVVKVLVEEGQIVEPGDAVIVVEAMKMQNELAAERGGKVTGIKVTAGDVVELDTLLVVMEALEEDAEAGEAGGAGGAGKTGKAAGAAEAEKA